MTTDPFNRMDELADELHEVTAMMRQAAGEARNATPKTIADRAFPEGIERDRYAAIDRLRMGEARLVAIAAEVRALAVGAQRA